MTDIEKSLNSSDQCADNILNEDCGAGAIAGAEVDTVFFTGSPLTELVWSQHKGLSLKYCASALSKKKASLLWNTESFNIMISSQQVTNIRESSNTKDFTAEASSMEKEQKSGNYGSDKVTFLGFPSSIPGAQPDSSMRIHDNNRGSFGDDKPSNRKGKSVLDNKSEHNQSWKEVGQYVSRNNSLSSMFRPELETLNLHHNQPTMPDGATDETWLAYGKDSMEPIRYQSDCDMKSTALGKGNENVISGAEYSVSISEREHSHECVDRSKRIIPKCKRVLNPDPKTSELSNSKRQKNEKSCSGSSVRQHSSFMNWISTITSSHMRSDQAIPLTVIPYSSPDTERHPSSLHNPHDTNKDFDLSCRYMESRSNFKGLYHPLLNVHNSTSKDLHLQREVIVSKEHKFPREELHRSVHMACDSFEHIPQDVVTESDMRISIGSKEHFSGGSVQLICDGDSGNLHSTSSERLNHGTCHVQELPLTTINVSSQSSKFHEKTKCNNRERYQDKELPKLYDLIAPAPSPGNKGTSIPVSDKTGFLQSFWIRRMFPNFSSPTENTTQYNQCMELESERVTKNCKGPNSISSNWEQSNSRKYCHLDGQKGYMGNDTHYPSINPIDPNGSKKICEKNLNSNLSQLLPSEKFKKSEQMAPLIEKRLDAFRHIIPSTVSDIATCSTTTCLYCGKSGHSIQKCSELDEIELEDLLKNMGSFNGTDNSSWCIQCFQIGHWAISCPHTSSKRKHIAGNAFIDGHGNCNIMNSKPGMHNMSSYDGRVILSFGSIEERHQIIDEWKDPQKQNLNETAHRGNARAETNLAENSDISRGLAKVTASKVNSLSVDSVKEDIAEGMHKVIPAPSSLGESESKENQIIPYCNIVSTEVADESVGIFEIIRGLRLSRTDIIRWMKSPVSRFSLEGFFLRIRTGKWEEGLGGTGYHVAHINGINCENSLSVCIGEFTFQLECCFVSNHDFVQEELKVWWSEILKRGGKPPTREELNKKLQERIKFGY